MDVGKYRHRLAFQSATDTRTADGGVSQAWATTNTVWGRVDPLDGSEVVHADKTRADATHRANIRHGITVTPAMRFTYDSRTFQILSVLNIDERDRELTIIAQEIVT
jgi:SPP1 family predicted phage head-tail adaptor